MSNPRYLPSSVASQEAFRKTLKSLLRLHYDSSNALDRSWTFRYPDDDHRDLMVEVTQVLLLARNRTPHLPNRVRRRGYRHPNSSRYSENCW